MLPREHLSPIQQFICNSATRITRNSVKSRSKEPKENRSQPNYPDSQSVLRTITQQGYKLWSPLIYGYNFILFISQAFLFSTRRARWLRPFTVDDSAYPQLANPISFFSTTFTKTIAKKPELSLFVVQVQRRKPHLKLQYKGRRELKDPRWPTEPSHLLYFEKTARLR